MHMLLIIASMYKVKVACNFSVMLNIVLCRGWINETNEGTNINFYLNSDSLIRTMSPCGRFDEIHINMVSIFPYGHIGFPWANESNSGVQF